LAIIERPSQLVTRVELIGAFKTIIVDQKIKVL